MTQTAQLNVSNILQGLILASILWAGATLQEVKTTVTINDYRITQLEAAEKKAP